MDKDQAGSNCRVSACILVFACLINLHDAMYLAVQLHGVLACLFLLCKLV
jgi:hypothetical protein